MRLKFLKLILIGLCMFSSYSSLAAEKSVVAIQHWQTKNGVPVYFVESRQNPMLNLAVVFHAGSIYDGEALGLAQITNSMLDQGAGDFTADQIAQQFDQVGANFGVDVGRDQAIVTLQTLTDEKYLKSALDIFATVLTQPTFDSQSLDRIKKQTLAEIDNQQQTPTEVAGEKFYQTLFANQPYGHDPLGNPQLINAITTKQVQTFYKKYYGAKNAIIALVGDISRQQAEEIANQIAEKLPPGETAKAQTITENKLEAQTVHVNLPAAQMTMIFGQYGITYRSPDYFPLLVGNYILGGGGLVSVLFKEVREKSGYTYRINSQFIPYQNTGVFYIFTQSRKDKAAEAEALAKKTFSEFVNNGITSQQLDSAKKFLLGSFVLSIDSNSNILEQLVKIGFYQLPLDYLDTYQQKINAVTVSQVNQALRQTLKPNEMITVIVGD